MENDWQADVDRFAAALDADEKSPLTVRNYRRELRVFADWYRATYQEPPGVRDLTHEDMRAYKDSLRDRKLEPATINLALAALHPSSGGRSHPSSSRSRFRRPRRPGRFSASRGG